MDQNPIDDFPRNVHDLGPIYFGPLHDESEVSEEELRQPTLGNNWNIERFQGLLGDPVDLVTNCIQISCDPNWKLQKYRIHFKPNVNKNIKNELLMKHISLLGEYVLDGNTMYSYVKYESKTFTIHEQHGLSDSLVMITINHMSEVEGSDSENMPIVVKFIENCIRHLKLIQAETYYFDRKATVTHQRLGLRYWPGYLLGVRKFNDQFALCIELLNRCTALKTVLDFFHVCCGKNRNRVSSLMNNFKASIIGTVVLTSYDNKLYKIHGVDENLNINSTFIDEDGSRISYKDYYEQKWNIFSLDEQQPMLKTTYHNNDIVTLYLVPQLCIITEFTDVIRKKQLVKEFSQFGNTNYAPNTMINKYNRFLNKMLYKRQFLKALQSWNFSVGRNLIRITGRVISSMTLNFCNHLVPVGSQGYWTDRLELYKMVETPHVEDWVVLTPSKYFPKVKQFIDTLRLIAERMALHLSEPEIVQINDVTQISYMNHLDEIISRNGQFILCVIKSLDGEFSSKINRKLCLGVSVPSQLLSLKQIITDNDLSRHTKIVIQINCKLGGMPWSVADVFDENIMVVGLNIYRDSHNEHKYFCGVMVSLNETFTKYASYVDTLNEENISEFYVSSIANALSQYKALNQKSPRGIIIYRDGLEWNGSSGEACISEVKLMKEKCVKFFCNAVVPFMYILIRKSEETKLFNHRHPFNFGNPLPGTIVDSDLIEESMYDFFLISHTVKSGTALPTYYRVLFNSIPNLMIEELHIYTYLLTHIYFKCSHTIEVPAPCQYAYDLAYFCANTLNTTENILLHGYPFFL